LWAPTLFVGVGAAVEPVSRWVRRPRQQRLGECGRAVAPAFPRPGAHLSRPLGALQHC